MDTKVEVEMKIFVIIVTYKGRQWYERCFGSLRQSTIPVQTVVVDNASNDGTVEYIRENYPEIHLIESKDNLGFGRANNIAMRYALDNGCDYVFLLNQDAWIESNAIEELVRMHKANPSFGVLSPMHVRADMKSLYIQLEDGKKDHGNKLLSDCYFNRLEDVYPLSYVNAAAWLLPRNTLETVGGFDPIFNQYGEDDDYLNRVRYHGLSIGLCPKVRIVHDHNDAFNANATNRNRYYHSLLAAFIDPNKNESVCKYQRYLVRKVLLNTARARLSEAKQCWADYKYIKGKKTEIKNSREHNIRKFPTWLM